jgi:hypothetical protein
MQFARTTEGFGMKGFKSSLKGLLVQRRNSAMKYVFIRSLMVLTFLAITIPIFPTDGVANTTVTLEKTTHFLTTDGSDVVVKPGIYAVEAAEEWLRLIPGERKDALLLEAMRTQHDENLKAAKAVSQPGEADEYRIVLLLPGGKGLEAIGSVSGVRSRAVRRPSTSRTRTQQRQASRIPTQSTKRTVVPKSKPIHKSPVQPNNPLAQRVQTLEQQVSTLLATINSLQNRLAKFESAVQVSSSGKVTVNGTTLKFSASIVDVQAGTSKFSGLVKADTLVTNKVVSKAYTPGAGNIW